jgi:CHAD domain-containing protein
VVLRLARELLAAIRGCEEGVLRGQDPECLHQYRVRLRRLRALLSRLRRVVPRGLAVALGKDLRDLARRTNRLRDLDVLLLAEDAYRLRLREDLRSGLDRAYVAVRRLRGLERGRLVRLLRSRSYSVRLDRMQGLLAEAAVRPAPRKACRPIDRLVRKRIRKAYRGLAREADRLPPAVPDAGYHRLRIHCKRVRYLLDLFRELLEEGPVAALSRRLRALQEVLGTINDLAVQRGRLAELLGAGGGDGSASGKAVTDALWRRLDRRRAGLDRQARRLLCRFCDRDTARLVAAL